MDNYKKFTLEKIIDGERRIIPYYEEDDFFKEYIDDDLTISTELTIEHFTRVNRNRIGDYWIRYCYNSLTPYARAEKYSKERHDSLMFPENIHSSILQKDETGIRIIEKRCPKIAWGFTAFMVAHSYFDEQKRLRCEYKGKEISLNSTIEKYHTDQKEIYDKRHESDYKYYFVNGFKDEIHNLDITFLKEQLEQERELLEKTIQKGDNTIIEPFITYSRKYLEYVENKLNERTNNSSCIKDDVPTSKAEKEKKGKTDEGMNTPQGAIKKDIDYDTFEKYFKSKFKGIPNKDLNFLKNRLIPDLQESRSDIDYAKIALLIYESDMMAREFKPKTFTQWYKIFCEIVGCKYHKEYYPNKLKDDAFKRKFHYLE